MTPEHRKAVLTQTSRAFKGLYARWLELYLRGYVRIKAFTGFTTDELTDQIKAFNWTTLETLALPTLIDLALHYPDTYKTLPDSIIKPLFSAEGIQDWDDGKVVCALLNNPYISEHDRRCVLKLAVEKEDSGVITHLATINMPLALDEAEETKGEASEYNLLVLAATRSKAVALALFDGNLQQALWFAIKEDDIDLIEKILAAGADPNTTDAYARTALHLAARHGSPESIEKILNAGSDLTAVNKRGCTALHFAAQYGSPEMVGLLLNHQANPNAIDDTDETALHDAARSDHAKVIRLLLEQSESKSDVATTLNAVNKKRETALLLAAKHNNIYVVRELLSYGINRNTLNSQGETALDLAIKNGNTWAVEMLRDPILCFAIKHHCDVLVEEMLTAGADTNVVDEEGETPLHLAVERGGWARSHWVAQLLAAGADPNAPNKNGHTALHYAVAEDSHKVVKQLLTAGANPNATDKDGKTALHCAIQFASSKVVALLLAHQANLNAIDNTNETLLHKAARTRNTKIMQLLLTHPNSKSTIKTLLDAVNKKGETALHLATKYGHKDAVNKLVIASLKKHIEEKKAARSENEHLTHPRFDFGQKRPSIGKQIAAIEALIEILEQGGNPENLLEEHHKELTNSDVKEFYNTVIKCSKADFTAEANDSAQRRQSDGNYYTRSDGETSDSSDKTSDSDDDATEAKHGAGF